MAISGVGTNYYQAGTPTTSVNVSPASIGNCFLLYCNFNDTTNHITGISGGGATNWTNLASFNAAVYRHEIWLGQPVYSLGIQAVNLTFNSSVATTNVEIDVQEFTNGNMASTWFVDGSQTGHVDVTTNTTSVTFASLTPSGALPELYYGAARCPGGGVAGVDGYTYQINAANNVIVYNSGFTTTGSPACTQTTTDPFTSISVVVQALVWGDVQGGTAGPTDNAQPGGISFTFASNVTAPNRIEAKVQLNEQTGPSQITLASTGTAIMGQWLRVTEAHITISGFDCVAESWTAVVISSGTLTVTATGANTGQRWQMAMCCRERSGLFIANDLVAVDGSAISAWNASPFQLTSPAALSDGALASVGYFDVGSNHTITAGTGFTLRNFSGASTICESALEDVGCGPAGSTVTGQWNGWDPGTSRCLDVVLYRSVLDPGANVIYPAGDGSVNSWTTQAGGTTNLWQQINEVAANDATYDQSPFKPTTAQYYETLLQGAVPPYFSTYSIAHCRVRGFHQSSVSPVSTLKQSNNNSGVQTTLSVSPTTIGNIQVLVIEEKYSSGSNIKATGVSGGGVTTWTNALQRFMVDGVHGAEIWWGVVTATGASTVTVTYNTTTGQVGGSLDAQEFTAIGIANVTWSVDKTGFNDPNTTATTYNYPSLTSTNGAEVYIGYLAITSSASAGSGTGWTYTSDLRGNWVAFNPNVGAAGTAATTSQTSGTSQLWFTIGALISASGPAAISAVMTMSAAVYDGTTQVESTSLSPTASWSQSDVTLSAAQQALITDWTNVRMRFIPSGGYNSVPCAERMAPSTLITQTNLVGTVSAIQDDPTSPDANWLTATSSSTASVLRVSFGTPTLGIQDGAGLQTFRAWVRKKGGTGTPTSTIELWSNGVKISTLLAATNVTSTTGQLLSATWDASNQTATLVQLQLTGTVGGSGGTAATIEVGAVDWVTAEGGNIQVSWANLAIPAGVEFQGPRVLQAVSNASLF